MRSDSRAGRSQRPGSTSALFHGMMTSDLCVGTIKAPSFSHEAKCVRVCTHNGIIIGYQRAGRSHCGMCVCVCEKNEFIFLLRCNFFKKEYLTLYLTASGAILNCCSFQQPESHQHNNVMRKIHTVSVGLL